MPKLISPSWHHPDLKPGNHYCCYVPDAKSSKKCACLSGQNFCMTAFLELSLHQDLHHKFLTNGRFQSTKIYLLSSDKFCFLAINSTNAHSFMCLSFTSLNVYAVEKFVRKIFVKFPELSGLLRKS